MKVPFTKMNSQGNDFVVIDNTNLLYQFNNDNIHSICSRKIIGCDQLLILNIKGPDNVCCEIFNQDGSSAKQCGNGMRAIMLFLNREYHFTSCKIFVNLVPYSVNYINQETIKVDMGIATFIESTPSFTSLENTIIKKDYYYNMLVKNKETSWSFSYSLLSIGNPHCVVFSKGSFIYKNKISNILNSIYDGGVNICFILNTEEFIEGKEAVLELCVNERGSGWTKSCGSGATAAGAFIFKFMSLSENGSKNISTVNISQEGGDLQVDNIITNDSDNYNISSLTLSGPSTFEYDGIWHD